mmetsp:Transcript_18920/g.27319  ORF Transcript_18920/g.27319 Transcript_18920/m.27319 type:complete len:116 (+) Transcript_18920:67-414(+)
MSQAVFRAISAVGGSSAVALGAYGAHGLKSSDLQAKETWKTATQYQLLHSAVVFALPSCATPTGALVSGTLMTTGMVLFCGSCYATVLNNDRKYSKPAPFGGVCLILGWLALGVL